MSKSSNNKKLEVLASWFKSMNSLKKKKNEQKTT